ncbi:MAG: queuosine precursor transporter [Spirochaetaceae bacterium]|jgi:uncharacterized integral membrane protein (TIGR00697 family)|nr:queuosine precursor transporter [Spirochaetaceae bacterium]
MHNTLPVRFRFFDIVMALFSVVIIVSNIASSAKIVDLGVSLAGIPLAFDGGTLLFPISYIFGDVLTEVYGFKASRRVIWTGFILSAVACAVFSLLAALPGEAEWSRYAGDAAYQTILGGMSSGGIVVASLAGYLLGEFSNSVILSKIKIRMKGKLLFVRTISSTLVGELLDSIVFISVATLFGVFPRELLLQLIVTNYILKSLLEIVLTPFTYLVIGGLKKAEGVDVYDEGVKYYPLSFHNR